MNTIDTTNMCSHLQKKLFDEDGVYHRLWLALQDDPELTAVVRSRQLHIYRNGKKVLVLASATEGSYPRQSSGSLSSELPKALTGDNCPIQTRTLKNKIKNRSVICG